MGSIEEWINIEMLKRTSHHATEVIAAVVFFGIVARVIMYLIPDGPAKKAALIIDDIVLLAVFIVCGWKFIMFLWHGGPGHAHASALISAFKSA